MKLAVWEGTFPLGIFTVKVAVLDTGERVILKEDMEKIFAYLAEGRANDNELSALMRFCQGRDLPREGAA